MFLRLTEGFYAGQVREFPAHVGNELLRAGRAVNPYADPQPDPPALKPEPVRTAAATGRRGRNK